MAAEFKRALWVEAESEAKPLSSQSSLGALLDCARRLKLSDLYVQVYRGCRGWFETKIAHDAPWQACRRAGFDPLQECTAQAAALGIKVHAWINVFNAGPDLACARVAGDPEKTLLRDNQEHPISSWLAVDRRPGGFSLDTPALWFDPASPEVEDFLGTLVAELFSKYKGLAGLHLDFFRYPYVLPIRPWSGVDCGYDFGYSENNLKNFEQSFAGRLAGWSGTERGTLKPADEKTAVSWDSWRRFQITRYLSLFRARLPAEAVLSAAVLPWADRAYLSAFQNWRSWLSEGLIDRVLLMSYTGDHEHFSQMVRQASVFKSAGRELWAGIGAYKLPTAAELQIQESLAKAGGADGACLFSYGELCRRKWNCPPAN